jgi:hypothetical protein
MKRQWLTKDMTTWVLMVINHDGLIPEWRVAGYLIKLKLYESLPATWVAYAIEDTQVVHLGNFDQHWKARRALRGSAPA